MFEKRLYYHVDWAMLAAILALCLIGVVQIYSATALSGQRLHVTQMYGIILGLVALVVCLTLDYRSLADKSHFIYLGILALLVFVLFFGVVRGGSRRWIDFGSLNLQPSEFAKATVALVLAKFFGDRRGAIMRGDLMIAGAITAVPFLVIARQPDLGTAVTLVPVLFAVAFVAGMPMRIFGILAIVAVLAAPIAWKFALQDYQRERVSTFLDPEADARGAGYQQLQARITTGSGGPWGKGFQKGTQGQLRFLPVAHNDFIFSVLAEEHGFAGVIVTLGLYLFVILRALESARLAKDRLGAYLVVGVLASFTFQVIYNITMSAGLAPVKGLTLPLMSYGGSSMIATLAGFGLILNVRMRRFTN
jgi:rod shape determining protein RodA